MPGQSSTAPRELTWPGRAERGMCLEAACGDTPAVSGSSKCRMGEHELTGISLVPRHPFLRKRFAHVQ